MPINNVLEVLQNNFAFEFFKDYEQLTRKYDKPSSDLGFLANALENEYDEFKYYKWDDALNASYLDGIGLFVLNLKKASKQAI